MISFFCTVYYVSHFIVHSSVESHLYGFYFLDPGVRVSLKNTEQVYLEEDVKSLENILNN